MSADARSTDPYSISTRRSLLVLAAAAIVHGAALPEVLAQSSRERPRAGAKFPAPGIILGQGTQGLPPAVADMRAAILAAVETGDFAELKLAMDLNELKPEFGGPAGADPIAYLKSQSGDPAGREMLAILGRILDSGWAAIPGGRDIENNRIYVWPHFAEVPLSDLKPADEVALYRLITPAEASAMRSAKRWQWWRLSIGADGVWHMFTKVK